MLGRDAGKWAVDPCRTWLGLTFDQEMASMLSDLWYACLLVRSFLCASYCHKASPSDSGVIRCGEREGQGLLLVLEKASGQDTPAPAEEQESPAVAPTHAVAGRRQRWPSRPPPNDCPAGGLASAGRPH